MISCRRTLRKTAARQDYHLDHMYRKGLVATEIACMCSRGYVSSTTHFRKVEGMRRCVGTTKETVLRHMAPPIGAYVYPTRQRTDRARLFHNGVSRTRGRVPRAPCLYRGGRVVLCSRSSTCKQESIKHQLNLRLLKVETYEYMFE